MSRASDFSHEYDLTSLQLLRPRGRAFEMLVTPRYRYRYEKQSYEVFTAALLSRVVRRARLFIDVGAHYGFFTLLAATENPALDIIVAEPTPETFTILSQNVQRLGTPGISLHQVAVSNAIGSARYVIALSSDNCGFYPHPNAPPLRTTEVETVTVDALLRGREPCPVVVKIDTDGHEIAVLEGMAETLRRFDDLTLFIEFNPKMQRAAGYGANQILEELNRLGFATWLLDDSSQACPSRQADHRLVRAHGSVQVRQRVLCPQHARAQRVLLLSQRHDVGR
jgi:FkbM family methyltransferase